MCCEVCVWRYVIRKDLMVIQVDESEWCSVEGSKSMWRGVESRLDMECRAEARATVQTAWEVVCDICVRSFRRE